MSDPISDFLARIRNAQAMKHHEVKTLSSKMSQTLARIFKEQGFLNDFSVRMDSGNPGLFLNLKYDKQGVPVIEGLRRVSRPGLRVYCRSDALPKVRGGMGMAVVSTSHGVMTAAEAEKRHVGGEVLCYVW